MLISSVWRGSSLWFFGLGLGVGASVVALATVLVSEIFLRTWLPHGGVADVVLAIAVVAAALHESQIMGLPLPQNSRQVPERIGSTGPMFGAFQFGVEMGTGMRTFMTSALPYVLLLAIFFLAEPLAALAGGIGFGFGRWLVPIGRGVSGLDIDWSLRFEHQYRALRFVLLLALVCCLLVVSGPYGTE